MKTTILTGLFLALIALGSKGPSIHPIKHLPGMNGKPDSLAIFYKLLDLKAEGDYNNVMSNLKHRYDRLSPDILRAFIEKFEPQRLSFVQGVSNLDGSISFWWYLNEFAVKDKADIFMKNAGAFLTENDFNLADPQETDKKTYTREENGMQVSMALSNFVNYTGGPLCGGSVYLCITWQKLLPEPSIGEILKLYPAINCYVLPTKVDAQLRKNKFTSVSYGGTWENYYIWDTDIKCLDENEAETLYKNLVAMLIDAGYRFRDETGENKSFTYEEAGSISVFTIKKDDTNILSVRFQPAT